jgi:hypothetical protein
MTFVASDVCYAHGKRQCGECKKLDDILQENLGKLCALDRQVSGDHYKQMRIQPVEYIHQNGIGFLEGNAIKYLSRHREKGRADDIRKAIHYCEMILEMEYGHGE